MILKNMYLLTDSYLHVQLENGLMVKIHDVGDAFKKQSCCSTPSKNNDNWLYFLIEEKWKK